MAEMEILNPEDYLFLNLDYPDIADEKAQGILELCQEYNVGVKLGTELTSLSSWADSLAEARARNLRIFADTKADDIPNTVEGTLRGIFRSAPQLVNIHAGSGIQSLKKFIEIRDQEQSALHVDQRSLAIAVTVLTPKSDEEIRAEYNGRTRRQQVRFYAQLAASLDYDGVTCAGDELYMLDHELKTRNLAKVALGVRPAWAPGDDQIHTITPGEAIRKGARFLGVGRAVTNPPASLGSPRNALEKTLEEVSAALPQAV